MIKFEIALLLTESSNQLLTDKDDTVGIASPGSSSGVLKTGQLKKFMSYENKFQLVLFYMGDLLIKESARVPKPEIGKDMITDRIHDQWQEK